jgi:hypothetical protein
VTQVPDECRAEGIKALALFIALSITIVTVLCMFAFFREDKEEQITPLSPQMIVKDEDKAFTLTLTSAVSQMLMTDTSGKVFLRASVDYPDPDRPQASGVAARAGIKDDRDVMVATVLARRSGPHLSIVICRASYDIFGFPEQDQDPDARGTYKVRHKTGLDLLFLSGNFDTMQVEGKAPAGTTICRFGRRQEDSEVTGSVLQGYDVGLVFAALLGVKIHHRLSRGTSALLDQAQARLLSLPQPGADEDEGSDSS